jgi:hypothetical protein
MGFRCFSKSSHSWTPGSFPPPQAMPIMYPGYAYSYMQAQPFAVASPVQIIPVPVPVQIPTPVPVPVPVPSPVMQSYAIAQPTTYGLAQPPAHVPSPIVPPRALPDRRPYTPQPPQAPLGNGDSRSGAGYTTPHFVSSYHQAQASPHVLNVNVYTTPQPPPAQLPGPDVPHLAPRDPSNLPPRSCAGYAEHENENAQNVLPSPAAAPPAPIASVHTTTPRPLSALIFTLPLP